MSDIVLPLGFTMVIKLVPALEKLSLVRETDEQLEDYHGTTKCYSRQTQDSTVLAAG